MGRVVPVLLAFAFLAPAAEAPPGSRFRLGEPRVVKLDWGTRSLVAADLDGDGRTDLAVVNNTKASVELLYQRGDSPSRRRRPVARDRWQPVLEDAPFERARVAIGQRAFSLSVGDLDGDGRPDLAYTGSPDPLTVRFQGADGEFRRHRVLAVEGVAEWSGSTAIVDLDGDGRAELVVATRHAILVWKQDAAGQLTGPDAYPLSGEGCSGLQALDLDRDGRVDLLYQQSRQETSVRARFGLPGGGLGPEEVFRIGPTRGLVQPLALTGGGEGLLRIQGRGGLLELLALGRSGNRAGELGAVRPRVFSSQVDAKSSAAYALADVDGDRRLDVVIADSRGARLWLLRQEVPGQLRSAEYPSLAGVRSLAAVDLDRDGRSEVFLASPQERALAWTAFEASGRLAYPRHVPLPGGGQPQAVAAGDLDGGGSRALVVVVEDRSEHSVVVVRRGADGSWDTHRVPLKGLSTPPRDVRLVDLNADGRLDIAVVAPQQPVQLLMQSADGSFAALEVASGFVRGLVEGVEAAGLGVFDLDGDGRREVVVTSGSVARVVGVGRDGALEVRDQLGSRSSDTRLVAAAVLDVDGSGAPEVVLVPRGGEALEVLRRGRDGVFRFAEEVLVDPLDVVAVEVADLDGNGRQDLLLLGKTSFQWLPLGVEDRQLESRATWESDLEGFECHLLGAGDLDGDGRDDVVAVDSRGSRVLEVLSVSPSGGFEPALHFVVFDADPHYRGETGSPSEPRQVLVADLTGDGRDDLALLVHDRILVYPQE